MSGPAIRSTAFGGPELVPRLHQIHHALLAAEAPDEQAHDGAGRDVRVRVGALPLVALGRPEPRHVDGVRQEVHAVGRHAGGDRLALERVRDAGERVGAPVRGDHGPRQQRRVEQVARRLRLEHDRRPVTARAAIAATPTPR